LSSATSADSISLYIDTLVQDPLFIDAISGDVRLMPTSPAINAGDNALSTGIATDLDGNPRIRYGIVDMGAYEFAGCPDVPMSFSPPDNFGADVTLLIATKQTITADNMILPNQLVQYHGELGILLEKNFEVQAGAMFEASPEECVLDQ